MIFNLSIPLLLPSESLMWLGLTDKGLPVSGCGL